MFCLFFIGTKSINKKKKIKFNLLHLFEQTAIIKCGVEKPGISQGP